MTSPRYEGPHVSLLRSLYYRHVMKWGGYRSPLAKKKAAGKIPAHEHPRSTRGDKLGA